MTSKRFNTPGVEGAVRSKGISRSAILSPERRRAEAIAESVFKPKMAGEGTQPHVAVSPARQTGDTVMSTPPDSHLIKGANHAEMARLEEIRELERKLNGSLETLVGGMDQMARQMQMLVQMQQAQFEMFSQTLAQQLQLGTQTVDELRKIAPFVQAVGQATIVSRLSDQLGKFNHTLGVEASDVAKDVASLLGAHAQVEAAALSPQMIMLNDGGPVAQVADSQPAVESYGDLAPVKKRRKRRTPEQMAAAQAEDDRLRSLGLKRGRGRPRKDGSLPLVFLGAPAAAPIAEVVGRAPVARTTAAPVQKAASTQPSIMVDDEPRAGVAHAPVKKERPRKMTARVAGAAAALTVEAGAVEIMPIANNAVKRGRGRPRKLNSPVRTVAAPIDVQGVEWGHVQTTAGVLAYSQPLSSNPSKFVTLVQVDRQIWSQYDMPSRAGAAVYADFDGEVLSIGRKGSALGKIKSINSVGVIVQVPNLGNLNLRDVRLAGVSGAMFLKGDLVV